MTGFWLINFIVLWILVICGGLVILALAREVEEQHQHIDSLQNFLNKPNCGSDGRELTEPGQEPEEDKVSITEGNQKD